MPAAPPPRRVWLKVFQNLMKSLSPGYVRASSVGGGKYIGDDYMGNKYFEKPADPERGRNIATRYFEVADHENYCQENLPSEWDSWLRHRRRLPPTEEEVQRNLQIALMKKKNADALAMVRGQPVASEAPKYVGHNFPVYNEYELNPGQYKPPPGDKQLLDDK
ncbi:NADH dehydrogenase [ubiquinone] 1 alpha subcomplex subunit 12 [Trinorchestia longiramus]|nr:NADH dehydrogenase [ubiquinone] 1 alpha subcomplex subunit 12 [Trinorchestia longiramus]